MKVLQINCVYNSGSTGKITHDLHKGLTARGIQSVVCYGRGKTAGESGVIRICSDGYARMNHLFSRFWGIAYGGCHLSTRRLIRILEREKPDVVHLQCINGHFLNIYRLLSWLKASGIPTVLTLHAEFMYTANCAHGLECEKWKTGCGNCPRWKQATHSLFWDRTGTSWQKMHAIYRDWQNLTVVGCSDWILGRAAQSGEMKNRRLCRTHNGIDIQTVFYPRTGAEEKIRAGYGIPPEKKLILFVSPAFSEAKGFDLLLKLIDSTENLPFSYLLVGEDTCLQKSNAAVVGKVADQDFLAQLYSAADALVICSRCETYPTVCLEATCCGTPVAGFAVGGVKETIPPGMGGTVPFGDLEGMKRLLLEITQSRPDQNTVEAARAYHSKDRMIEEYIRLYDSLLQKHEK